MRLVSFIINGKTRLGVQFEEHIIDLPGAYTAWLESAGGSGEAALGPDAFPTDILAFLQSGEVARTAADRVLAFAAAGDSLATLTRIGLAHLVDEVTYLPPVPRPGKMICLGRNYRSHVKEMDRDLPEYPVLFAKLTTALVGHRQAIQYPSRSTKVDYEAELAVVIGRACKDVTPESAYAFVAGYTIFNDVSVRDYQSRTIQWLQGKNFDATSPLGPAIVTADEISDPQKLDISLRLNGEIMQDANTVDLVFDIPTTISYISQIMTLEPGDVIATGTPGGVGIARDPQVFLKPGDVVEVEIEKLGILENPVIADHGEKNDG